MPEACAEIRRICSYNDKLQEENKKLKEENEKWEADDESLTKVMSMVSKELGDDGCWSSVDDIYDIVKKLKEEIEELNSTILARDEELGDIEKNVFTGYDEDIKNLKEKIKEFEENSDSESTSSQLNPETGSPSERMLRGATDSDCEEDADGTELHQYAYK